MNRNKKENPPKRWDKIIGAVTLLTIVIFGFIIYNDYNGSSSKTASVNAEKNTVKQTESEKVTKAETDTKKNSNRTQVQGNPTVCIDAAHGGSSTGGASGNYTEKAITLSVALKVKEYLEESGVNVVMTRTSDRDVTNEQRVKTSSIVLTIADKGICLKTSVPPKLSISTSIVFLKSNSVFLSINSSSVNKCLPFCIVSFIFSSPHKIKTSAFSGRLFKFQK